jgi:hypothetical protein
MVTERKKEVEIKEKKKKKDSNHYEKVNQIS